MFLNIKENTYSLLYQVSRTLDAKYPITQVMLCDIHPHPQQRMEGGETMMVNQLTCKIGNSFKSYFKL